MKKELKIIFQDKIKEVQEELQLWMKGEGLLDPGEVLVVNFEIIKTLTVKIRVASNKYNHLIFSTREPSDDDWNKILSIQLSKKNRAVVMFFRDNKNTPASEKEMSDFLEKNGMKRGFYAQDINAKLSINNLPYRLESVKWEPGCHTYKFCIAENR